jgi:N-acetylglucosamine malate deacetylase 1
MVADGGRHGFPLGPCCKMARTMWPFTNRLRGPEPEVNRLPQRLDCSGARRILVIAPHPDDESLGCGGTLAQLAPSCDIHVLLVTNGDGGGDLPAGTSETRKTEMENAVRALGVKNPVLHFDEPDGRFADSQHYRAALAGVVARVQPNWVLLPWLHDSHADHARIARASSEVLARSDVELLLYYETWVPVPATHVNDITATLETKQRAIRCHETALRHGNYLDAIVGLNVYRGLGLGGPTPVWAEAFVVTGARDNRLL